MATVNDTVRNSLLAYPTLFEDRTSVLHHILCVIGNGFNWVNGEAVETMKSEPWSAETDNKFFCNEEDEFIRGILQEAMMKRQEKALEIIRTVESRVLLESKVSVCSQTPYALLMKIPKNVTPDWAEACKEIKVLAKENGWRF